MVNFNDLIKKEKALLFEVVDYKTKKKIKVNFFIDYSPLGTYNMIGVVNGVSISSFMFKITKSFDLLERRTEVAKDFRRKGLLTAMIDYLDILALEYRKALIKEGVLPRKYREIAVIPDEHAYMTPNGIDFWFNRLKGTKREFIIKDKYKKLSNTERRQYAAALKKETKKYLHDKDETRAIIKYSISQGPVNRELSKLK